MARHTLHRRIMLGLGVAGLLVTLGGCSRIKAHQGYLVDNLLIDSIEPGIDNRQSVEGTLGRPTFVSQFTNATDGGDYYYVARDTRQLGFGNPKAIDSTVLRVRFDAQGNVQSVERSGMDALAAVDPMSGETPTLGRDRTIWQEIFGNIGAVGAGSAARSGDNTGPNGS